MKQTMLRIALAAASTFALLSADPAAAQRRRQNDVNTSALPQAEVRAMEACVQGVIQRLKRERATYRAVSPAVTRGCDAQLRAVLGAAIRVGEAGPCRTVDGCIAMARTRAGEQASREFQLSSLRR